MFRCLRHHLDQTLSFSKPSLQGKVPEIHLIGDCREPHLILEAIHEGFRTALTI